MLLFLDEEVSRYVFVAGLILFMFYITSYFLSLSTTLVPPIAILPPLVK